MVLRFPPDVRVEQRGRHLLLAGRAGSVQIDLHHMDPTGLLALRFVPGAGLAAPAVPGTLPFAAQGAPGAAAVSNAAPSPAAPRGAMLLCASPSKRYFRGVATHVDNQVR
jgi:hypothetical protein